MNYDTFLRFIFSDGMFDYFEMTQFNEFTDKVEIYFEERNNGSVNKFVRMLKVSSALRKF